MFLGPEDMGDPHVEIVTDSSEVVEKRAITANDHRVFQMLHIPGNLTTNQVVKYDLLVAGLHLETPSAFVFVDLILFFQNLQVALVNLGALGLVVWAIRPVNLRSLVPSQAEPLEAIENRLQGFLDVSFGSSSSEG